MYGHALQNTSRKSYIPSQTQPSMCFSDDQKCPKSPLAPDFGTQNLEEC